jgi:hypothetical protein
VPDGLKTREHIVVRVVRLEGHPQLEAGGMEQAQQSRESRLAPVPFVGGDHRRRDGCTFGQFPLTHPCFEPGELQQCRSRARRFHIRLYHDTIVSGTPEAWCGIQVTMTQVDRLSVTMPPEIGAAVRNAAERQGTSVSNWLVAAAAQRLRNELLGEALDRWEAEDGPFSDKELDAAAAALGTARRRGTA